MLPKLIMLKKVVHPLKMKLDRNNKLTNEDTFHSLGSPSNKRNISVEHLSQIFSFG